MPKHRSINSGTADEGIDGSCGRENHLRAPAPAPRRYLSHAISQPRNIEPPTLARPRGALTRVGAECAARTAYRPMPPAHAVANRAHPVRLDHGAHLRQDPRLTHSW